MHALPVQQPSVLVHHTYVDSDMHDTLQQLHIFFKKEHECSELDRGSPGPYLTSHLFDIALI